MSRDITPTIDLIRGLASDDWEVRGAISELVDNSFGEARGNASRIDISWNPSTREFWQLDNGAGMDDVARLFQLGDGVGRHPKDIGRYGMGGTMALIWLPWGESCTVWTKRGNYMASLTVHWSEMKDWEVPSLDWRRASLVNTPPRLLALSSGTLIAFKVRRARRFHAETVQKELTRRYAPGLRAGREIYWHSVVRGKESMEALVPPAGLPNPINIDWTLVYEDKYLPVVGVIGQDPSLGLERSQVEIGFGARVVKATKDCYTAPDESHSYTGLHVAGYIDLGEGWQDYLTTAKTDFTDVELYRALMGALFERLKPLLQENEDEIEAIQLNGIAMKLSASLSGGFEVDAEVSPGRRTKGGGHQGGPDTTGDGTPRIPRTNGEGREIKRAASAHVLLKWGTEKDLEGLLFRVEFRANDEIWVWLDKGHEIVAEARRRSSPAQEMLLETLVLPQVSAALVGTPELLHKALERLPNLRSTIAAEKKVDRKQALLTTHLLNGARQTVAA